MHFISIRSLRKTTSLTLPHKYNVLGFKFSGLNYHAPEKHEYAYQLEGFDPEWRHIGNRRTVTYTNLNPGKYLFKVKASNSDGVWSKESRKISLTILAPWYRTPVAYISYILLIGGLIVLFYRMQLKRRLAQNQAAHFKQLDEVRTTLYTNITHEFRTPLSVIRGIVDEMEESPELWLKKGAQLIRRNSAKLLELVNQMLHLQKIESGRERVQAVRADVVAFLRYLHDTYTTVGAAKEIEFLWESSIEELEMDFDPDKLTTICSNLYSNAIKYTPPGGTIRLQIQEKPEGLHLAFSDNGVGIASEKMPFIFDRFYQADDADTRQQEGSGIGLALVQSLVELMGGTVSASSQVGEGSTFLTILPITRDAERSQPVAKKIELAALGDTESPELTGSTGSGTSESLPRLLVVEDNADVRAYLLACLQQGYQIDMAINGREGLKAAHETVPDLVISDVMMPLLDGFELCEGVKSDDRTSHIPVLLLTAKADDASRVKGLSMRADAYIAKPFRKDELLLTVYNLLESRRQLRKYYLALTTDPSPEVEPKEHAFLQRVRAIIEGQFLNEDFKITDLAAATHMSRSQLHNKLTALTGQSATRFVRSVKLHHAKEMLKDTDHSIAEIAYQLGFKDPNYFTRIFNGEVGMSPTRWRRDQS